VAGTATAFHRPLEPPAEGEAIAIPARSLSRARAIGWVATVVLGALAAWGGRFAMNADGIAYLDSSDRILSGAWLHTPNAYWGPAFPALIAAIRAVIGAGPAHDYPAAHLATFVCYLAAAAALDLLVRSVAPRESKPSEMLWGLAFLTFLWVALTLIRVEFISPDMAVAAETFAAAALALRVARGVAPLRSGVALGIVLAVGYLTKAVMFPLALVVLVVLATYAVARPSAWRAIAAATIAFAIVSAPQLVTASRLAGRPTFSETGSLVYAWYVDHVPCPLWTTGIACLDTPGGKTLSNTDRPQPFPRLTRDPSVFTFAAHPEGTFPAWYDPTLWYRGVRPVPHPKAQLRAIAAGIALDWRLLTPFIIAVAGFLVLATGPERRRAIRRTLADRVVWLPALAALAMYALVYSEARYLGASMLLLVIVAGAADDRAGERTSRGRLLPLLVGAAAVVTVVTTARVLRDAWWNRDGAGPMPLVAAIHAAGIPEGTRIGVIGNGYVASFWARPARVKIIAEVHQSEAGRFWSADSVRQQAVLDAFRVTGALAVVAERPVVPAGTRSGWRPVTPGGSLLIHTL